MTCVCGHDRAAHVSATASERQGCRECDDCVVFTATPEPGGTPPEAPPPEGPAGGGARLFLDDGDVVLWQGDVLEGLARLPDNHVDCVVTSPPYFALRDYGTGRWEGGDPDHDHHGTHGAGCPPRVCAECGHAPERILRRKAYGSWNTRDGEDADRVARQDAGLQGDRFYDEYEPAETIGWTICGHGVWRPGLVLDPFVGTGTTARVARAMGLEAVGIDLSAEYLGYAAAGLAQLSLFAGAS